MSHAHLDHDDHDHDHDDHGEYHGHGGHDHAPADFGRAFAIGAALNIALVVAQVIFGVVANSVALIAHAGHNLGDVLGLLLACGAHGMSRWHVTARYTYGFQSASILVALFNGVVLMVATGAIAWEALRRLADTGEVAGVTVMIVAGFGTVMKGA